MNCCLLVNLTALIEELVVVAEWMTLGVYLGVPYHHLKKISRQCKEVELCKMEMLDYWLNNCKASYESLVKALSLASYTNLAEKLRKKHQVSSDFLTGKWPLLSFCVQTMFFYGVNNSGHLQSFLLVTNDAIVEFLR